MNYKCFACCANSFECTNFCVSCGERSAQDGAERVVPKVFGTLGRFALRCPACNRLSARDHQYCGFDGYPFEGDEMEYASEIHYSDEIVLASPGKSSQATIVGKSERPTDFLQEEQSLGIAFESPSSADEAAPLALVASKQNQRSTNRSLGRQTVALGLVGLASVLVMTVSLTQPALTNALQTVATKTQAETRDRNTETKVAAPVLEAPALAVVTEPTRTATNVAPSVSEVKEKVISRSSETASASVPLVQAAKATLPLPNIYAPRTQVATAASPTPSVHAPAPAITSAPLKTSVPQNQEVTLPTDAAQIKSSRSLEPTILPARSAAVAVVAQSSETLQEAINAITRASVNVKLNGDSTVSLHGVVNSKATKQAALNVIGNQPNIARIRDVIFIVEDSEEK